MDDGGSGFGRRRLLGAGGLLTLAAVLDACTGEKPQATAPTASASSSAAAPSTPAPPPLPTAVGLLDGTTPCVLTPDTIAGPTWFDAHAVRSDIRDGRPGTPLDLAFRVVRLPDCAPVPDAVVDLWQCDAGGIYSGFAGASPGEGGDPGGTDEYGDPQSATTEGTAFLRGTQVTGLAGVVTFATVYPGWYPTRTPHLHLKVHLDGGTVLTTQLFFDDTVNDAVLAAGPYAGHPGRDTRNDTDAFYADQALLRTAAQGDGWLAAIVLGVV
ncbi:hypothetical protein [Blastococcus sp. URHD0036]|uniref:dioxygenase family protein n=1 Tax=Blastococcus sp. URHD0036 TaxID=1380356 RepID=UPI00049560A3|nr:hypothetical protein [Blastococcus sp. URHD0036]